MCRWCYGDWRRPISTTGAAREYPGGRSAAILNVHDSERLGGVDGSESPGFRGQHCAILVRLAGGARLFRSAGQELNRVFPDCAGGDRWNGGGDDGRWRFVQGLAIGALQDSVSRGRIGGQIGAVQNFERGAVINPSSSDIFRAKSGDLQYFKLGGVEPRLSAERRWTEGGVPLLV